jgi:hypothetical protein
VALIMAIARRRYTAAGLRIGDALSRRWLARNASPLAEEVAAVARAVGQTGAHLLNLSYEWGCTCGADATAAPAMLRVLDWDLGGLGETLSVIRQRGPAGDWLHVGWPGLAGAITAFAPGRFAIAINQMPLPPTRLGAAARNRGRRRLGMLTDWAAARPATWRSRALPPAHLLRIVADEAPDYAAALARLRDTEIAAATAFTLIGCAPGEAAVIERQPTRHALREGPHLAVSNHWVGMPAAGAARWVESRPRLLHMQALLADGIPPGLDWLRAPLLNHGTRLAAVMRPAEGRLILAGFDGEQRVSEVLDLSD